MTSSIKMQRNLDEEHLDKCYRERYYWYLTDPQFLDTFQKPIADYCACLGERVLDVCCGEGALAMRLSSGMKYLGFDASQVAVDNARDNARACGMSANASFVKSRCENFGLNVGLRDVVVFGGVMHCLIHRDSHRVFIEEWLHRTEAKAFIIYDLEVFDSSHIQQYWTRRVETIGTVKMPKLPTNKRTRKIEVYWV